MKLAGKVAISAFATLVFRNLAVLRWAPRALVRAGFDAGRAWAIAPLRYRLAVYARDERGGWLAVRRRRFRLIEVLKEKRRAASSVFVASLTSGLARSVIIPHYPEEGLAANLLHVLEVVRRLRSDASVYVDWVLEGTEIGFRYGEIGDDVWARLFRGLGTPLSETAHRAATRIDFAFWGTGKDHLSGTTLQNHRRVYHAVGLRWLEITNQRVLEEVCRIQEKFLAGRFCVGIHRRVGNALVADLQSNGYVPSSDVFVKTVESILSVVAGEGISDCTIVLATDDAEAVTAFRCAFGNKLFVRDDVQRTISDAPEVHFRDWDRLSIADAEDVLIDIVLLSKCNVMVHASSSVSTVASIVNPSLILVRV
ncbi:MAG: hypothetical protein AB7T18_06180 [Alphaproteobacteria bacterium]